MQQQGATPRWDRPSSMPPPTLSKHTPAAAGTTLSECDAKSSGRDPSGQRRSRRRLTVCGVVVALCVAVTGTYIYFLLARGGILLEPREVSVAFENAGIQVDLTLSICGMEVYQVL